MSNKWILLILLVTCSSALSQEVEEEYTAFDVYLGERQMGIATAYYTTKGDFRAEEPEEIVKSLALKKNADEVIALFKNKFNTENKIEGIGSVVVDTNIFTLTVLLEEQFFEVKKLDESAIKSNTDSKTSLRLDVIANYQESTSDTSNIGFKNSALLSFGKVWAEYSSEIEKEKNTLEKNHYEHQLEELNLNAIYDRWHLQAGYTTSLSGALISGFDILGASIFSESLLLQSGEDMRGSSLEIYVPSESIVRFYREGLLIDSQTLESGKQQVNTSNFPQGSYFIDVEIESDPLATKKRYYFAKSGFLTPRSFPNFRLDVGRKRTGNEILDDDYFSSELRFRLMDSADLRLAIFGDNDDINYLMGFNAIVYDFLIFGSASWKKETNDGLSLGFTWDMEWFSISGEYERSFRKKDQETLSDLFNSIEDDNPTENNGASEIELEKSEKINFSISQRISDFELIYKSSFLRKKSQTIEKNYGPRLLYHIINNHKNNLSLELSYKKSDTVRDAFYFGLKWQQRYGKLSLNHQLLANKQDELELYSLNNRANYNDISSQTGIGVRADVQSRLEFAEKDKYDYRHSLTSNLEYGFSKAKVLIGTNNQNSSASSSQRRSYSVGSSFILNLDGNVAMGPTGLSKSLLIVNLNSFDDDIATEILVNRSSAGVIKGNGKILLSVNPFQSYNIRIKPATDSSLTRYDNKQTNVLLFPGQVSTVDYKIEKIYIAMGILVDKNNQPLSYKNIKGTKDLNSTEEDGSFQVEVSNGDTLTVATKEGTCTIVFPKVDKIEYFHDYEKVMCQ